MFKAIRALKSIKPKKKLVVEGENGLATNEKQQAEIITDHFNKVFVKEDEKEIENIEPKEMTTPFTEKEVQAAVKSLSNNKSPGCDNLKAELIKHCPETIFQGIAILLNHIATTGEYPNEVKTGILIPLPKPGKKQGPPQNLRPIILLSILRKILAIIMIRRTAEKLNSIIPITQAAYRPGRSTTEHVFTLKILAEKAITSSNYEIHLLLLDMSKAFDTVKRATLIQDLKEVLEEDELHIFYILLKDVQYQVRCGETYGKRITTNVGTPQGDCASALLFTLYLAKSLQDQRAEHEEEHNYARPNERKDELTPAHLQDHNYHKILPKNSINIDQQYADDISYATTNSATRENIKMTVPKKLKKRNLNVNLEKTEEYTISRTADDWKKCKYLGSLLETENDIKRRKGLAIDAFNTLNKFFANPRASITTKAKIFKAFITSIFLYNSEIWTLTKEQERKVDVFQRSLLRRILKVTKLDKIRNEDLYEKTRTTPWSQLIKQRRLRWLGHLLRLDERTPARQALDEFNRKTKRPRGKPKHTWWQMIEKDTAITNIDHMTQLANDRAAWRDLVRACAMSE